MRHEKAIDPKRPAGSDGEVVSAAPGIDRLDAEALLARLPAEAAARLERLDVLAETDSTSTRLLEAPAPARGTANVCVADLQHVGRGRRGRSWRAPAGAALCLSIAWRFDGSVGLAPLPLAAGVAVRRALVEVSGVRAGLKWPNDLSWDERKLGGILVERRVEAGDSVAVIGVGVNVAMPQDLLGALSDWPRGAVDLAAALGARPPERNSLAAAVVAALVDMLIEYERAGPAAFREELAAADVLHGREVRVTDAGRRWQGRAAGIDGDGALRLELPDGAVRRIIAGDVQVRADP